MAEVKLMIKCSVETRDLSYLWLLSIDPNFPVTHVHLVCCLFRGSKMEARIKKIFHRKRDDASGPSLAEDHSPEAGPPNSAIRTSLYDFTSPREPPQTGTLPFQGNSTRISTSTIFGSGRDQQNLPASVGPNGAARLLERSDERPNILSEIPVSQYSSTSNVDNEVCQFLPETLHSTTNYNQAVRRSMQASQGQAKSNQHHLLYTDLDNQDDKGRRPIRVNTSKEVRVLLLDFNELDQ